MSSPTLNQTFLFSFSSSLEGVSDVLRRCRWWSAYGAEGQSAFGKNGQLFLGSTVILELSA